MKHTSSSYQPGQAVVLIALLAIGMIAMLGLVFDGGNAYYQRRRMQNASDASAFAGARKLALRGTDNSAAMNCQVRIAVETYAVANGVPGSAPVNCASLNPNIQAYYVDNNAARLGTQQIGLALPIPSGAVGVEVVSNTSFNTFFLGVLNVNTGTAGATAKATYGPLNSPESLQPMAVKCDRPNFSECFTVGQRYNIWECPGCSGNFGWLSWNGNTNSGYITNELNPDYTPPTILGYVDPNSTTHCSYLHENCWVQGVTGVNNSSDNREQLDKWIGKTVTIIVFDTTSGSGSHTDYHVVGFASFVVESYDLPGKAMWGRFVSMVTSGQLCTSNCYSTGTNTVGLRQ